MIKKLLSVVPCRNMLAGLACPLLLALPVLAQDSNAPTVMKPTVVTGSYIPVSEGATVASPVDIVTTEKIEQAGATDLLNTLRKINPNFAGNGNVGAELDRKSTRLNSSH